MKYKTRFLILFVGLVLVHLATNFVHPVTPTIIQELALPDYMFGLALAAMQLANFLMSPFWGQMNLYISSRQSLLFCCFAYGLAQIGFAYSTTQAAILLARVLAGAFAGGIMVSLLTYVVNIAKPEDQGKFLTYSATLHSVFGAFGYLVGGLIGEYSIRATFLLQAVIMAIAGILFRCFCLPDAKTDQKLPTRQLVKDANPLKAFHDGNHHCP